MRVLQGADLSIELEKAPWAKWIVRDGGVGPSKPTCLQLSRAAVPNKVIKVPALAAGAVHEVVVTPALERIL